MKDKMWKIVLCTAAVLLLAGCGNDSERVIEGSPSTGTSGAVSSQESVQSEASVSDETPVTPAAAGYTFVYQDVVIAVDTDAAAAIAALPEPQSYFEAASCAFEGLDKIYTYSGYELDTYPQGEQDYVSAIILKDDSVSTPEGLSIGDTKADVEAAYGTDYLEQENMLTYEKDGMELRFILQGENVISIEYRSTVLDE